MVKISINSSRHETTYEYMMDIKTILSKTFKQIEVFQEEIQNSDYCGCFIVNQETTYRVRVAKITPKKIGQFVAIWEKDEKGNNVAYSESSFPDCLVVYCFNQQMVGCFKFPKDVLKQQNILKTETQKGKMGFRVYPPWDKPIAKQALKTQAWQVPYFEIDERHFFK